LSQKVLGKIEVIQSINAQRLKEEILIVSKLLFIHLKNYFS